MQVTIKRQHLQAVLTHAAIKDVRYYLQGVLIERTAIGRFYLVATDGNRMAVGQFHDPECDQTGPWSFIIPAATVKSAIKGRAETVVLKSRDDGKYELADQVFAPVDGRFPDWRRVVTHGKPGGVASQFDFQLLADAQECVRIWRGDKPGKFAHVEQRGTDSAYCIGPCGAVFVLVMPLRISDGMRPADLPHVSYDC